MVSVHCIKGVLRAWNETRYKISMIPSVRIIALAMLVTGLALSGCKQKNESKEKVWIIPTFTTADGHAIQMGFNNPALPNMTMSECQAALHEQIPRVIAEARAQEPRVAQAKLTDMRCVSAVGDPLASAAGSGQSPR